MNRLLTYSLALLLLAASSCKKNFVSDTIVRPAGLPTTGSSIRVYNIFGSDMDVTVNNVPLTSYSTDPGASGVAQGLALFPGGVWPDGSSFTIPYSLLDKNGKAHISVSPRAYLTSNAPISTPKDTVLTDDPLRPRDYFILSDGRFLSITRVPAAPASANDFKIRVINLSAFTDTNRITGPVTVTYADGSNVDPKLNGVNIGQISDYVELPYSTTEFKVFANGNWQQQLAEFPSQPDFIGEGMHPVYLQESRFSPSRPFKPGGIYAILVIPTLETYQDRFGAKEYLVLNAYRIISENSPSVNYSFARLQAVNVYSNEEAGPVTVRVDGQTLSGATDYGGHTEYNIFIQGDHQVQAFDKDGKMLAEATLPLYANDNITAWVYARNKDTADICFSATDMSTVKTNMQLKFMNFCTGVPYLTVTDGLNLLAAGDSAAINIPFGRTLLQHPFMVFNMQSDGGSGGILPQQVPYFTQLLAFISNPGPPQQVPGAYLESITPLTAQDFIANPSMYSLPVPAGEPGAYSIALIGKAGVHSPDPAAARFLILKHTK